MSELPDSPAPLSSGPSRRLVLITAAGAASVLGAGLIGGGLDVPPALAATLKNGRWCNPAIGTLTSGYGDTAGRQYPHAGWDIANPTGTPIYAAAAGTVVRRGWNVITGRTGNGLVVSHGSNVYTYYGHLSAFRVSQGASVKAGQRIGDMGATGNVTGPHLHFEVQTGSIGSDTNPRTYLSNRGSQIGGSQWPALDPEARGERARAIQYLLRQRGRSVTIDGYMGPQTTSAVKSWQSSQGLVADGQIGPKSWPKLIYTLTRSNADGNHVRALQTVMNKRSAGLLVDGNFGPVMDTALKNWQRANRLAADGQAGPVTWRALVS
ncbi:peptidoglycan DD-metalloendopeptidase family protein [Sediminivirga luteola]|uniref:Peptidoglycan binding protein n=1 Tax=Sediminivirga luteola TaxID=1774748 RepID=A0A8J2XKT8_9MICO|nr:peptidoglycan DD-metalloendopeptidase family protein [Sediminivirga luteola]MCI2264238.1 peptidoglycan DD-metalloendopeptidase family protein [Sediminivirga luteola]GGA17110.1 hypothetical protein GCM10011333_20240 [Sediminivirga luteola]